MIKNKLFKITFKESLFNSRDSLIFIIYWFIIPKIIILPLNFR
jgi:hypothetical protein